MQYDKDYYEGNIGFRGDYSEYGELDIWKKRLDDILTIKKSGNLLDIGTAYGFFLRVCESKFKTFGCDISPYAVEKARINASKSCIEVCGTSKLPYENEMFDVVTMFDVIEHVEDHEKLLKEVYRVIKPDGIFVIVTPNRWSLDSFVFGFDYWYKRDKTHRTVFSIGQLRGVLEKSGFVDINIRAVELLHFLTDIHCRINENKNGSSKQSKEGILKMVFNKIHNYNTPFGASLYVICRREP